MVVGPKVVGIMDVFVFDKNAPLLLLESPKPNEGIGADAGADEGAGTSPVLVEEKENDGVPDDEEAGLFVDGPTPKPKLVFGLDAPADGKLKEAISTKAIKLFGQIKFKLNTQ